MNVNLLAPMALALSTSFLGMEGAQFIVRGLTPPTITGTASYGPPVRAGDVVLVPWTIDKTQDCPGVNGRVWDGADGFHLSEPQMTTGLKATDGPKEFKIQTDIPRAAPPGALSLRIVGHFDCPNEPREHFALGPVEFTVFP